MSAQSERDKVIRDAIKAVRERDGVAGKTAVAKWLQERGTVVSTHIITQTALRLRLKLAGRGRPAGTKRGPGKELRADLQAAKRMREHGLSAGQIATKRKRSEGTVRRWFRQIDAAEKKD